MELEGLVVSGPSREEDELASAPVVLKPLVGLLVKLALVAGELLL